MSSKRARIALALAGCAFAFAGCSVNGPKAGSGTLPAPLKPSLVSRDALRQSLLYVSNSETQSVDVYSRYMSKKPILEGKLTGFEYPYGACVDRSGNVYITDYYAVDIVEYAHGAITPLRTLPLTGFPIGCAVDPTTGNLAVSIWEGSQGYNSRGGVFIFTNASGPPTLYTDPNLWQIWPPAYDPNGNLFLLGYNPTVELAELPRGGKGFETISLGSLQIWAPGSVLWNGKYLDAVDQQYQGGNTTAVYRLAIVRRRAHVVRTSVLSDTCSSSRGSADVIQPLIVGATIISSNHSCKYRFDFWSETGGNPTRSLPESLAPLDGTGEAISAP